MTGFGHMVSTLCQVRAEVTSVTFSGAKMHLHARTGTLDRDVYFEHGERWLWYAPDGSYLTSIGIDDVSETKLRAGDDLVLYAGLNLHEVKNA